MKKRKHRVVVDITLEEPVTARRAKYLVADALDWCSLDSWSHEVTKFKCKEFNRVFRAIWLGWLRE